jgi:cell division protein FtsZ
LSEVGNITILAIGGAGCRIMRILRTLPGAESVRMLALDTDRAALESTGLPAENLLLAGELWRGGRGCGGSELDGQRAVAHERPRLEELLRDSKFLVAICGLGGGTASGGAPIVLSVAAKLKLPNLFMVTLPFMMEGPKRRNLAEKVLAESLFDVADAVVSLPDDLLFSTLPGDVPLAAAFEMADRECAGAALALSSVLAAGNLLNADMASLTALLKRRKSTCSIGIGIVRDGESPAEEVPEKLVAGMLASPLLGGPQVLKAADAAVVSMLGGSELSLGDVRNTLGLVAKYLPEGAEQLTAASSHPDWQGARQLCVLTIKYAEPAPDIRPRVAAARPRPEPRAADKPITATQGGVQLVFKLDAVSKGIMERTTPVMWNNEDLDEPTFKRRDVVIDDGHKGSATRR